MTYTYTDAWSLFALLRDHPPGSTDPQNQYELQIPNTLGAAPADTAKPPQTVVYLEVNLLPAGAKTGSATLPVPSFPYKAPLATLKSASGE